MVTRLKQLGFTSEALCRYSFATLLFCLLNIRVAVTRRHDIGLITQSEFSQVLPQHIYLVPHGAQAASKVPLNNALALQHYLGLVLAFKQQNSLASSTVQQSGGPYTNPFLRQGCVGYLIYCQNAA